MFRTPSSHYKSSSIPALSPSFSSSPPSSPTPPAPPPLPIFDPRRLPKRPHDKVEAAELEDELTKSLKRTFSATRPESWSRAEPESVRCAEQEDEGMSRGGTETMRTDQEEVTDFVGLFNAHLRDLNQVELELWYTKKELDSARELLKSHHDSLISPISQIGPAPPQTLSDLIISVSHQFPNKDWSQVHTSLLQESQENEQDDTENMENKVNLEWPNGSMKFFSELENNGFLTPEILTLFCTLPTTKLNLSPSYSSSNSTNATLTSALSILSHLTTFPSLVQLNLSLIPLPYPSSFPQNLIYVNLHSTGLSFPHLSSLLQTASLMKSLRMLILSGNEGIGDDSFCILRWLRALEGVNLEDTSVTREGVCKYVSGDRAGREIGEGLKLVKTSARIKDWATSLKPISHYLDPQTSNNPITTPTISNSTLPSSPIPVTSPSTSTSSPTKPSSNPPKASRLLSLSIQDPTKFIGGLTKNEINQNLKMLKAEGWDRGLSEAIVERRRKLERGWRKRLDEDLWRRVLAEV